MLQSPTLANSKIFFAGLYFLQTFALIVPWSLFAFPVETSFAKVMTEPYLPFLFALLIGYSATKICLKQATPMHLKLYEHFQTINKYTIFLMVYNVAHNLLAIIDNYWIKNFLFKQQLVGSEYPSPPVFLLVFAFSLIMLIYTIYVLIDFTQAVSYFLSRKTRIL